MLKKSNELNQMLLLYKHTKPKPDPLLYVFRTHKPHHRVTFMSECVEPLVPRACMLFHRSVDILRSDTVHVQRLEEAGLLCVFSHCWFSQHFSCHNQTQALLLT